jgi:hypothetical protein
MWLGFALFWGTYILWDLVLWHGWSFMGRGWYFLSYRMHFCYWTPCLSLGDDTHWYDVKLSFQWFRTGIEFAWHGEKK